MGRGGNKLASLTAAIGAIYLKTSEAALIVGDAWQLTFESTSQRTGNFRPRSESCGRQTNDSFLVAPMNVCERGRSGAPPIYCIPAIFLFDVLDMKSSSCIGSR